VLFERLHEDHARREHNNQVKRDFLKTQEAPTFSPVLATAKGSSPKKRPGLYEKLYQDFDKMQRKKLKQKYDHESQVKEELTFKPTLLSLSTTNLSQQNNQQQHHHSERQKSVFDILYSDH